MNGIVNGYGLILVIIMSFIVLLRVYEPINPLHPVKGSYNTVYNTGFVEQQKYIILIASFNKLINKTKKKTQRKHFLIYFIFIMG